jgi:hypothetical protein
MSYQVSWDDPRVVALAAAPVSREALAAVLLELRDIITAFAPELLPRPDPEPKGKA